MINTQKMEDIAMGCYAPDIVARAKELATKMMSDGREREMLRFHTGGASLLVTVHEIDVVGGQKITVKSRDFFIGIPIDAVKREASSRKGSSA